jgi:hypothetical protein
MWKRITGPGAVLMAVLSFGGIVQAEPIQSGPPVGEKVPGPFAPLNINGPNAGEKCCQYCKNGSHPVAVVFARSITPAVVELVKKIDQATAANQERGLRSFVVFCNDADGMARQLQELAQKENLQNTIVTLYKASGPERYRLAAEADVTVVLYTHLTVKVNQAFRSGELTGQAIDAILANLPKILTEE